MENFYGVNQLCNYAYSKTIVFVLFLFILTSPEDILFPDFCREGIRKRGRERERKKHQCGRDQPVASHMCPNLDQEWNLQLRYMRSRLGTEPESLWCAVLTDALTI